MAPWLRHPVHFPPAAGRVVICCPRLALRPQEELDGHYGCVNTVSFDPTGSTLISGSDDQHLILWDWAGAKIRHRFATGHRNNIFQASCDVLCVLAAAMPGSQSQSHSSCEQLCLWVPVHPYALVFSTCRAALCPAPPAPWCRAVRMARCGCTIWARPGASGARAWGSTTAGHTRSHSP